MRENRTYGSEGGEVLTHLSDPIKRRERCKLLWEAACGRLCGAHQPQRPSGLGQRVAAVARKRAPTNGESAAGFCGRRLAGDCAERINRRDRVDSASALLLSRESALPQTARALQAFVGGGLRATARGDQPQRPSGLGQRVAAVARKRAPTNVKNAVAGGGVITGRARCARAVRASLHRRASRHRHRATSAAGRRPGACPVPRPTGRRR